jgi:shikimate kinase
LGSKLVVCLVGLPSSGKTTVGSSLARLLNAPFRDTDQWIELQTSSSVGEIFESAGEAAFRDLETKALSHLSQESCILATGGGIVLRAENRLILGEASVVVYLQASPEDLLNRLRNDRRRPLLQGVDRLAKLKELHRERDPLYRDVATHVLPVAGQTARRIARAIHERVVAPIQAGDCTTSRP